MFRFGRNGLMGALLAALAIDSTERRRQLDADLAEQRERIREEQRQAAADRKAAEQAKREAESRQRSARAERRRLLAQRVYQSLHETLSAYEVPSSIGRPLTLREMVGQDTINRFAAQVTALVARELNRED